MTGLLENYPEFIGRLTPEDLISIILLFSLPFLVPYLYIKFVEQSLLSVAGRNSVRFARFKLYFNKPVNFIKRILEYQMFKNI